MINLLVKSKALMDYFYLHEEGTEILSFDFFDMKILFVTCNLL